MAEPAARPFGRNLADFLDAAGKLPAPEQALLKACGRGETCRLAPERPETAAPENTVRASFIRFLALGGDTGVPVHESGVWLSGGWIDGVLDLDFCTLPGPLQLRNCRLQQLDAREARLPRLDLKGTRLAAGINADGIAVAGVVVLAVGFSATGEVPLLGASIGGDFVCSGGKFDGTTGDGKIGAALSFDSAIVTGSDFLDAGFTATGAMRLLGASIGGNLECRGGKFDGTTGDGPIGDALTCDRATITGNVFLDKGFTATGNVGLAAISIGNLIDTETDWPAPGTLVLDGLRIGRFTGDAPTDGATRVRWLLRQCSAHLNEDFKPQPWEETIRVLREMGHPEDAKIVAVAKQDQLRRAGRLTGVARALHFLWGGLAGYGYRPLKLVGWMVLVWAIGSCAFWLGMKGGYMAPTSPIVITNSRIDAACDAGPKAGDRRWTLCPGLPDEYSTFQPMAYSLDLLLPVISLQQDTEWAPVVGNAEKFYCWGVTLRGLMWFIILFGWMGSLMLIAILTNLIKKD